MMLKILKKANQRVAMGNLLVSQSVRKIGYANLDDDMNQPPVKDYSVEDIGPKPYNPLLKPKLFTELDPAGLQEERDEDGNILTPFQAETKALLDQIQSKRGFDVAKYEEIDTEQLMKV